MAESGFKSTPGSGDKVAVAESPQAKSPLKNDKGVDSILDIFTSEDDEESSLSKLSRGLADVSIASLLEQTQKIAEDLGCGR